MFRNYIKISWRNLLKSKAYSLINISGLANGLACALAILGFSSRMNTATTGSIAMQAISIALSNSKTKPENFTMLPPAPD